jgi:hypothetical protein
MAAQVNDVLHAGQGARRAIVHARDAAIHDRAALDYGVEHPGHLHVDAIHSLGTHDSVEVLGGHGLADELEGGSVLEHRRLGRLRCGSAGNERAVADAAPARGVDDRVIRGDASVHVDTEFIRACLEQHMPRRGRGLPAARPGSLNAVRTAGDHEPLAVRLDGFHRDARPVGVELVAQDHRHAGGGSLTHLGLGYQ